MKKWQAGFILAMLMLAAGVAGQQRTAADLEVRLKAAMQKELVEGDLKGAIDQYKKIVADAGSNRAVAAKALLAMAQCYDKVGNADARKAYERLVREFADQSEIAAQARTRLASGGGAPLASKPTMTVRQVWTGATGTAAISPDGRHLVYIGPRDLSVVDLITGENRHLTAPHFFWYRERPSFPTFSPDGNLIAHACFRCGATSGLDLRIIALDGSAPRVLYRSDEGASLQPFDWSSDGKYILGIVRGQSGPLQIVLWSVADGSARVLKTLDGGQPQKVSLSRDGRYIVYDLPARKDRPERDIFLLGIDGGREVPLVAQEADDHHPIWTPDGSGILFLSARAGRVGAWFLRVVDGKPQGSPELVKQDMGAIVPMGFTRNGVFHYLIQSANTELFVAGLDPASGTVTAQPEIATQRSVMGGGTWSPNGQYLAYISQRPSVQGEVGARIIVIRSSATGEETELAPALTGFSIRKWSPDGRSLLADGTDEAGRGGVFRVDAQTGGIAPILYGEVSHSDWFLNGKSIAFIRNGAIVLRDLETSRETEVYRPSAPSTLGSCLEVSADGRRLAFYIMDEETRSSVVMVMTAPGEKPRELGARVKYPEMIDDIWDFTPDGRQVHFTTYNRESEAWVHKVWRIAVEGGAPQEIRLPMERLDYVGNARFHPDGRRIAFASSHLKSEVWAMENFLPQLKTRQ